VQLASPKANASAAQLEDSMTKFQKEKSVIKEILKLVKVI
jgi:hypothetical protein